MSDYLTLKSVEIKMKKNIFDYKQETFFFTVEDKMGERTQYRRNSAENWEFLIGESWECCMLDKEKELEKMFLKWQEKNS